MKATKFSNRRRSGLSLLEVLAAVTIMGILVMIAIPRFAGSGEQAKRTGCNTNQANIEVQVQLWFRNKGTWPLADLSDIMADGNYFPDGPISCPFDGSAYQFNSTTQRVDGHAH